MDSFNCVQQEKPTERIIPSKEMVAPLNALDTTARFFLKDRMLPTGLMPSRKDISAEALDPSFFSEELLQEEEEAVAATLVVDQQAMLQLKEVYSLLGTSENEGIHEVHFTSSSFLNRKLLQHACGSFVQ